MNLNKYNATIGKERLESFTLNDSNITEHYLLFKYENNIKFSQAYYPILSILEVTLRNAIDTMLKTLFSETWLEDELKKQNLLLGYDYQKLLEAESKVKSKHKDQVITHGRLVSELTLGFWVNICSKKYNPKIWTKKGAFRGVFVNYPKNKQEQIHELSKKLTDIKKFRNRIFHFEPIINKSSDIAFEMYHLIREVIDYLPKDGSNILEHTDNFIETANKIIHEMDNILNTLGK